MSDILSDLTAADQLPQFGINARKLDAVAAQVSMLSMGLMDMDGRTVGTKPINRELVQIWLLNVLSMWSQAVVRQTDMVVWHERDFAMEIAAKYQLAQAKAQEDAKRTGDQ